MRPGSEAKPSIVAGLPKPARVALTGFASDSRDASPWAALRSEQVRDREARHPHAVRIVARTWLRVTWV